MVPIGRIGLGDSVADTIRVLIVDHDPRVREGLRTVLALAGDLSIVGEAATCAAALEQTRAERPDVVLLDLELAAESSYALLCLLRRLGVSVIALAVYPGDDADALAAGATSYLLKDSPPASLLTAVRAAHAARAESPPGASTS